jgi:hypothetical protein
MQLSRNFTLAEFVRSTTADKLKLDNTAPPDVLKNLFVLAQFLESVRKELGNVPMLISSGYRCPLLNKAVGGASDSSHIKGLACDFTAPQCGTPLEICQTLAKSPLPFDQLIYEQSGSAIWVHIGLAADGMAPRRQVLTIYRNNTRLGLWE